MKISGSHLISDFSEDKIFIDANIILFTLISNTTFLQKIQYFSQQNLSLTWFYFSFSYKNIDLYWEGFLFFSLSSNELNESRQNSSLINFGNIFFNTKLITSILLIYSPLPHRINKLAPFFFNFDRCYIIPYFFISNSN